MTSAAAEYQRLEDAYSLPTAGEPRSPHEGLALLDFQLRFLSLLAASTMRSMGIEDEMIGQAPGFGEWLTFLRKACQSLDGSTETACVVVRGAVAKVLDLIDRGLSPAPSEISSAKRLRDYISHGGRLPSDPDLRLVVGSLLAAVSREIIGCLGSADLQIEKREGSSTTRPSFVWDHNRVELWPFMYVSAEGMWCIYSRSVPSSPSFLSFGGAQLISRPSDEETLSALKARIRHKPKHGALSQFSGDVRRDLGGFSDADSEPEYFESESGFSYRWSKATSEGVEHRTDQFRLGPNDSKEWRDESDWTSYSAYLRMLANWRTVASRLRQGLERIERKLALDEHESLGWTSGLNARTRDAQVVITDLDGSNVEKRRFSELIGRVDEALQANRGATQVVFINGEAGIGKTRAMVSSAKDRALEVESGNKEGMDDLPLFLYVRSTGQVLDSLSTVVSAAVTSTRNLTEEAVKALCRNGLMTLLIDGFDELLGGAGYSDAMGSLRPWLSELGGRGVLVLSARSSYYVNQYRSSVDRATRHDPLEVRHRIAEIQRWGHDEVNQFLEESGVPSANVQRLSTTDQRLLGLPFFARVFAEICLNKEISGLPKDFSLRDKLLSQYVAREENKLLDGTDDDTALLNHQELMRTFELVAEFMAGSAEREVDVDALEVAAGLAIEADPETRHGLKQRLPVLCGLAATAGELSSPRFQFQHELFFDQFLAGAAAHYLKNDDTQLFLSMLRQAPWRSATVTGVVTKAGPEIVAAAIIDFSAENVDASSSPMETTITATNLGALWAEVFRELGQVPSTPIMNAHFTDELDLSDIQCRSASFIRCTLFSLILPSTAGWHLSLEDTKVRKIETKQIPPNLSGLHGVLHAELMELLLPGAWLERRPEILTKLQECGAAVVDAEVRQVLHVPPDVEAARFYLRKLAERAEISIVLYESGLQPDDDRLKWTQVYGRDEWKKFVTTLTETGLGSLERFPAAGKKKVRLRFRTNTAPILDENSENQNVRDFWERLTER